MNELHVRSDCSCFAVYIAKNHKIGMFSNVGEVEIGRQQRKAMVDAGRSDQAIDRTGLNTMSSTSLPEFCGSYIGGPIKRNERKRLQDVSEAIKVFFVPQPVEEFLENVPHKEDSIFPTNVRPKGPHIWVRLLNPRTSKHQRPDRRINDKVQRSVRSCL